jgi:hypothetical protein
VAEMWESGPTVSLINKTKYTAGYRKVLQKIYPEIKYKKMAELLGGKKRKEPLLKNFFQV